MPGVERASSFWGTYNCGMHCALALAGLFLVLTPGASLRAQWLNTPTPGIPRLANGKANLTAPTPKAADGHPDFTGLWDPETRLLQDLAADIGEQNNLAAAQPGKVQELHKLWYAWNAEQAPPANG